MADSENRQQPLILIIDDEIVIRECFTDILEDSGYEIITAENGRIGLEMIEQHRPDCILCDMQMPEVGGLEVVRDVRQKHPQLPIILISGAGSEQDAVNALQEGAWNYLLKPLKNIQILEQVVVEALKRAGETAGE